jgi:hypothetical protein
MCISNSFVYNIKVTYINLYYVEARNAHKILVGKPEVNAWEI